MFVIDYTRNPFNFDLKNRFSFHKKICKSNKLIYINLNLHIQSIRNLDHQNLLIWYILQKTVYWTFFFDTLKKLCTQLTFLICLKNSLYSTYFFDMLKKNFVLNLLFWYVEKNFVLNLLFLYVEKKNFVLNLLFWYVEKKKNFWLNNILLGMSVCWLLFELIYMINNVLVSRFCRSYIMQLYSTTTYVEICTNCKQLRHNMLKYTSIVSNSNIICKNMHQL